jgi:hypothetical protein
MWPPIQMSPEVPDHIAEFEHTQFMQSCLEKRSRVCSDPVEAFLELEEQKLNVKKEDNRSALLAYYQAQKCKEQEEAAAQLSEKEKYVVLAGPFSQEFHKMLAKAINQHPETLRRILSQQVVRGGEYDRILHKLQIYYEVLSYLNNVQLERGVEGDMKVFQLHTDFGVARAKEIRMDIFLLKSNRFPSRSQKEVVMKKWVEFEFPVMNLVGTVHERVKQRNILGG